MIVFYVFIVIVKNSVGIDQKGNSDYYKSLQKYKLSCIIKWVLVKTRNDDYVHAQVDIIIYCEFKVNKLSFELPFTRLSDKELKISFNIEHGKKINVNLYVHV